MPKSVLKMRSKDEWEIPCEALRGRIDRHLHDLIPYREFKYDYHKGGFYVRIIGRGFNDAQHMTRQGPYYYKDLSALARMVGIFHLKNGVDLPPVTCFDRNGVDYPETVLPSVLRFEVISKAYADMARQLIDSGKFKVVPIEQHEITAPVTAEEPNPGLDEYVELTEEQERALSGLDPVPRS